jgi:hypothetical protein
MSREYVILARTDHGGFFEKGTVAAHSPEQAIKSYVKAKASVNDTVFAAVPKRNWTVARPTLKQVEPVIELEIIEGQLTVDDVLEQAEDEGLIEPVADTKTKTAA